MSADKLDSVGRVIDFSVVKEKVGGWIDEHWDHNTILSTRDPLIYQLAQPLEDPHHAFTRLFGREPYVVNVNPTAENMAQHLFDISSMLLKGHKIKVVQVQLYETPNCSAVYSE